jgi:hypothetical protein
MRLTKLKLQQKLEAVNEALAYKEANFKLALSFAYNKLGILKLKLDNGGVYQLTAHSLTKLEAYNYLNNYLNAFLDGWEIANSLNIKANFNKPYISIFNKEALNND